jgi:hypothetical protein
MITSSHSVASRRGTWQDQFVAMLPEIESLLKVAFRNIPPDGRADACEDGLFHCISSYFQLHEQDRAEAATASSLVWYAMLQVRRGRVAGCRLNGREMMSRYAQISHGFKVVPLQNFDPDDDTWINDVVESRNTSVLDQIAIRMDFRSWLESLGRRTRRIAVDLAKGFRTREVASKYRVSASRISQIRRDWKTLGDSSSRSRRSWRGLTLSDRDRSVSPHARRQHRRRLLDSISHRKPRYVSIS